MQNSVFNPTETPTPADTTDPRAVLATAGLATTGPARIERDVVHRPAGFGPTPEDLEHLSAEQIAAGWFIEHGKAHRGLEMAQDAERRWVVRGRADIVEAHAARGDQVLSVWIRATQQFEDREVTCYGTAFDIVGGHRGAYVYVKPTAPTPRHLFPRDGYVARPCAQCGVARRALCPELDRHGVEGDICAPCSGRYPREEQRDYTQLRPPVDRAA